MRHALEALRALWRDPTYFADLALCSAAFVAVCATLAGLSLLVYLVGHATARLLGMA